MSKQYNLVLYTAAMEAEIQDLSKRRFLVQSGLIGLGLAASSALVAARLAELAIFDDGEEELEEHDRPWLKSELLPDSMLLGVAPDHNDFDGIPYANDYTIVNYFSTWNDWLLERDVDIPTNVKAKTPMISLLPFNHAHPQGFTYQQIKEQKARITKQAEKLSVFSKFYFRFGYEMNGSWYRDGVGRQTAGEFIDGYKYVIDIVRSVAPQAEAVWCPNVGYTIAEYYPGDDFVDVVALDGYNKYNKKLLHARNFVLNQSFQKIFGPDIRILQDICDKPIMIAEVGIEQGENNVPWLLDALHKAATYDRVFAVCLFAWNKASGRLDHTEADWGRMLTDELHLGVQETGWYKTGSG
ncbi:MAG: hypothetical protein QG639_521 [Patescibacteria group bacterium]|nr:hypothetical protein [Patescibacteria group bacterium]